MKWIAAGRERCRALLFRARQEAEMDEELRFHLEIETKLMRELSAGEARRQAQLRFGGVERCKEEVREARGIRILDECVSDLRYAIRSLRRAPAFTLTVLLTLGLCIGGNVAIFSVVYSVLLKPLPVPESDRILLMHNIYPGANGGSARTRGATSVPHYYDRLAELGDVFAEQSLYTARRLHGRGSRQRRAGGGVARDPLLLQACASIATRGSFLRGSGGRGWQRAEGHPQLRALAAAPWWRPDGRRSRDAHQ